jgi:hypothetical protein
LVFAQRFRSTFFHQELFTQPWIVGRNGQSSMLNVQSANTCTSSIPQEDAKHKRDKRNVMGNQRLKRRKRVNPFYPGALWASKAGGSYELDQ